MTIGLYFGSFNPIHHAHLIIANHILNEKLADKVWFVVSPHNPLKETSSLLEENHRLHLVRTAIEDDSRMKASDIEFTLPRPSYTVVTLTHLTERYPQYQFKVIMGGDSFQNIRKWKNYEFILQHYPILVYNRPGFEIDNSLSDHVTVLNAPLLELSATAIRKLIKEKKSLKYLLPEKVITEIEKGGYYRK
ncbi:nicotinate (nicotinamide) nucleotide adenylyltransferase [Niabella yanshanensis]|uniref:Probable nicotinate-nucleotide adenylyltransferase n=1 Tax=Niabella yanshanensis TaxID=577386 RepID=A0ABZ0W297_9BACT|nr:nicotinate (nicotinamide) nucleotide adenylyltransferase [Niabella yanshanensis]WQD36674.1 nicotinate (nicotinamide) nucleotide adenylyltransferase [Niabella yanshanensis]